MTSRALVDNLTGALDGRRLRLILLPTEKCNFRCTYCYEDFELGQMPDDVVAGIKNLIGHRADGLQLLEIDWFGGEPLLALPTIATICDHARRLSAEHQFQFRSSMTTNGYLLDEVTLANLVARSVRKFQVSVDGYGGVHDRTRLTRGKQGSFARIWDNLLRARDSDLSFEIMLRVHFHPANIDELPELLEAVKQELGGDRRFHVFFKDVGHYGGPNDDSFAVFDRKSRARAVIGLTGLLDARVESSHVQPDMTYVCYASAPNSLVVRSDGTLAKCTVAFRDPRNSIGRLRADGTVTIDQDRLQLWFRGLETQDAATLACPWSQMAKADAKMRLPVLSGP